MSLEFKVFESRTNPCLNRKELKLNINHSLQPTPKREVISKEISSKYKIPQSQIYVFDIKTGFGSHSSQAQAHLYNSEASFKEIARDFVIRKVTGQEKTKVLRRQRKETRKKKYKMFGTIKRNMKKAAKRNKD